MKCHIKYYAYIPFQYKSNDSFSKVLNTCTTLLLKYRRLVDSSASKVNRLISISDPFNSCRYAFTDNDMMRTVVVCKIIY